MGCATMGGASDVETLLLGGGVSAREPGVLGGGVSTCGLCVLGGGVATFELSVLGGGVATCIVSPRLEGRGTADASMAGGGFGTLLASGTAGGGIAVGSMVGKDLCCGTTCNVGVSMLPRGPEGPLGTLRFGRGGTFGGGGGGMPGPTFGTSSRTPTTLWASEMLADCPKCLPTRHSNWIGDKELHASAKSLGVLRASKMHAAPGSRSPTAKWGVLRSPPTNHAELSAVRFCSHCRPRLCDPVVHLCAFEERWCTWITFTTLDRPCSASTQQV